MQAIQRLQAVAAAEPYPLLFVTIGGAHLYGFPSADSDYDLRSVHVLPAEGHRAVHRIVPPILLAGELAGRSDLSIHNIREVLAFIDKELQDGFS